MCSFERSKDVDTGVHCQDGITPIRANIDAVPFHFRHGPARPLAHAHISETAHNINVLTALGFKRLKSLLHMDKLPTRTERTSRSWLYAHLILALLTDDLSQDFLKSSP
jgi:hypothetical protein